MVGTGFFSVPQILALALALSSEKVLNPWNPASEFGYEGFFLCKQFQAPLEYMSCVMVAVLHLLS